MRAAVWDISSGSQSRPEVARTCAASSPPRLCMYSRKSSSEMRPWRRRAIASAMNSSRAASCRAADPICSDTPPALAAYSRTYRQSLWCSSSPAWLPPHDPVPSCTLPLGRVLCWGRGGMRGALREQRGQQNHLRGHRCHRCNRILDHAAGRKT